MKVKNNRLEALRLIISSQQLGSQDELLNALQKEGFKLTQATLSRDLKQLKVAKAASMSGNYVYVLPNETMYKRVSTPNSVREMMNEMAAIIEPGHGAFTPTAIKAQLDGKYAEMLKCYEKFIAVPDKDSQISVDEIGAFVSNPLAAGYFSAFSTASLCMMISM